jgi:thiol-disulfide isomerase/thioredoxin
MNGHFTPGNARNILNQCDFSKNVDGSAKTDSDFCVGFDNYYDPDTNTCDVRKDRDGRPKTEEQMCLNDGNQFSNKSCNKKVYPNGTLKGKQSYCQASLHGVLRDNRFCTDQIGQFPVTYEEMETALKEKGLINRPKNGRTDLFFTVKGNGKPGKSLTLYYADWCPHCHDMMPEWKKLGKTHKGIKIQTIEQKQSKRKDITGFPTILFSDGKTETKYDGPRTKSGFVKFLKNNL